MDNEIQGLIETLEKSLHVKEKEIATWLGATQVTINRWKHGKQMPRNRAEIVLQLKLCIQYNASMKRVQELIEFAGACKAGNLQYLSRSIKGVENDKI